MPSLYAKFQNKMNKDIYLTNSLGSKKEKFVPINKNKIGMYVGESKQA